MNSNDIYQFVQKSIPVLQDQTILEELAENSKCAMFLLVKCTTDLSEYKTLTEIEIENNLTLIDSVIDKTHEYLHTGHWSEIRIHLRKLYFYSCFIKMQYMLLLTVKLDKKSDDLSTSLQDKIRLGDMAIMLGVPLDNYPNIMNEAITFVVNIYNKCFPSTNKSFVISREDENSIPDTTKKIKILSCPSIELFKNSFFDKGVPLLLKGCINHWPALEKWRDLNYIQQIANNRTVPIELGSKYTDESWSQQLMTLREFITEHIFKDAPNTTKGYLAQYRLFDQIPELLNDIHVPDYCCVSDIDSPPEINAWFGPQGTISPLHTDPKHNFLAQVVGVKQVVLFSPDDNEYLYPHEAKMLNNTSQIDLDNLDLNRFPLFMKAKRMTCTLRSGDMLYIPPKWWHHVTSRTISFSVSFWFE